MMAVLVARREMNDAHCARRRMRHAPHDALALDRVSPRTRNAILPVVRARIDCDRKQTHRSNDLEALMH
jgi:hypothetical protein